MNILTLGELLSNMPECQFVIFRPSLFRIKQTIERRCSVERYFSKTDYALLWDYPAGAEVVRFYAVHNDIVVYCN